jgi:outer membrane protein TolC
MYTLGVLLGEAPGALMTELQTEQPIPAVLLTIPAGFPSDLLRRRPDIRSAEAQLHAETALIGVAEADLFPRLSLTGGLTLQGSSPSDLTHWEDRLWSLGSSLAQPLFDASRRSAEVRRQEAVRNEVLVKYHQTVLNALKEAESALIGLRKEQERREQLALAAQSSNRAREAALALYSAGNVDFLNVVVAERALFNAEDALTSSEQSAAISLITLYKALGGGWEVFDVDSSQS